MLAKINRLRKNQEIANVFKKGKTVQSNFLFLKNLRSQSKQSRFAFSISAKIIKKAVTRNKIKRWIRVAVCPSLRKPDFSFPFDGVFFLNKNTNQKDLNFNNIKQSVFDIFQKIKNQTHV